MASAGYPRDSDNRGCACNEEEDAAECDQMICHYIVAIDQKGTADEVQSDYRR